MARIEKSIKCGEAWGSLLPLRRYKWHCFHCEVCSHNVAKKSAMTLVAGPTNSGCSGNGIQPCTPARPLSRSYQ